MPQSFDDVAECVETTLAHVGPRIVLALPLGIGKPNPLVNEFYRRARRDPAIKLKIFTALSLQAPQWKGELERRLLEPLVERLFGKGVPLDYVSDLHRNSVPENVEIVEFFLDPGALQLGIGELGDAVVYGLQLRQQQNAEFHDMLRALKAPERFGDSLDSIGGDAPFESGLYACTEMFVDGFLDLYRTGVLRRRVFDDARIQALLNDGSVGEIIDGRFLAALDSAGFGSPLDAEEFGLLQALGVFRRDCRYMQGRIENSEGVVAAAFSWVRAASTRLCAIFQNRSGANSPWVAWVSSISWTVPTRL